MSMTSSKMNSFFFFVVANLPTELGTHSKTSFLYLMQIRSQAQFQDLCQQHVREDGKASPRSGCCPSWSLGNYLAVLTNASYCLSLTSQQVVQQQNKLLQICTNYKHEVLCE